MNITFPDETTTESGILILDNAFEMAEITPDTGELVISWDSPFFSFFKNIKEIGQRAFSCDFGQDYDEMKHVVSITPKAGQNIEIYPNAFRNCSFGKFLGLALTEQTEFIGKNQFERDEFDGKRYERTGDNGSGDLTLTVVAAPFHFELGTNPDGAYTFSPKDYIYQESGVDDTGGIVFTDIDLYSTTNYIHGGYEVEGDFFPEGTLEYVRKDDYWKVFFDLGGGLPEFRSPDIRYDTGAHPQNAVTATVVGYSLGWGDWETMTESEKNGMDGPFWYKSDYLFTPPENRPLDPNLDPDEGTNAGKTIKMEDYPWTADQMTLTGYANLDDWGQAYGYQGPAGTLTFDIPAVSNGRKDFSVGMDLSQGLTAGQKTDSKILETRYITNCHGEIEFPLRVPYDVEIISP